MVLFSRKRLADELQGEVETIWSKYCSLLLLRYSLTFSDFISTYALEEMYFTDIA